MKIKSSRLETRGCSTWLKILFRGVVYGKAIGKVWTGMQDIGEMRGGEPIYTMIQIRIVTGQDKE